MDLDILSESLYNSDMPIRRKPKCPPGYNSSLLDAWLADQDSLLDRDDWLRSKGIDPETGHITAAGLRFLDKDPHRRRHAA